MRKILVSACLLGERCRYDGKSKPCADPRFTEWAQRFVPVCPEMLGGLPVPRTPCERQGCELHSKVISATGEDCTREYLQGAQAALAAAQQNNVICCILKECSPSCGSSLVYDGTFSGTKIAGEGVAAQLLRAHSFMVFSENEIDLAAEIIEADK